jgi:hypothetical protein
MNRLRKFVIQPVKCLTNIFSDIVRQTRNSNAMVSLLITRHLPVIFDDYLKCINKYGLVLPVSRQIHDVMPNIFELLVINPYNPAMMRSFIKKHDEKKGLVKPKAEGKTSKTSKIVDEVFELSSIKTPTAEDYDQISNMPMIVLILCCMLNAGHCLRDKSADLSKDKPDETKGTQQDAQSREPKQDIVTLHTALYKIKQKGQRGENAFYAARSVGGLFKDPPKLAATKQKYYQDYEESLHLRFNPPTMKPGVDYRYSLQEVIWGLLYDDPIPEGDTIYTGQKGSSKPAWKLTVAQRKTLDDFIEKNFDFRYDFYSVLQHGDRTVTADKKKKGKKGKKGDKGDGEEKDSEVEGESETENPVTIELLEMGIKGGLTRYSVERVPNYGPVENYPELSKRNKGVPEDVFDNEIATTIWRLNNLFMQRSSFLRVQNEMPGDVPFVASEKDFRAILNFRTEPRLLDNKTKQMWNFLNKFSQDVVRSCDLDDEPDYLLRIINYSEKSRRPWGRLWGHFGDQIKDRIGETSTYDGYLPLPTARAHAAVGPDSSSSSESDEDSDDGT